VSACRSNERKRQREMKKSVFIFGVWLGERRNGKSSYESLYILFCRSR
jgi:hypothetical protein